MRYSPADVNCWKESIYFILLSFISTQISMWKYGIIKPLTVLIKF